MHIGIDASRYGKKERTGVEQYSVQIINGLTELASRRKKHTITLYSPKALPEFEKNSQWVQSRIISLPRLWTQLRLSWEMWWHKPDVLFIPSHTLPLIHPKKSIVTIHDVAFRYCKNAYTGFQYAYHHLSTLFAVKKAYKIIVPSAATKKDLMGFYHCPEEKIEVIYHGVDSSLDEKEPSQTERKQILEKFGLSDETPFILFIGRLEAKKNVERLVEAFDGFSRKYEDWKLILGGGRGVGFKKLWEKVSTLANKNKILMPGYLNEREKWVLLRMAKIFVLPSLYEGFGFPVLEAFSVGLPVVCSGVSALREIAFDAAQLVNPLDIDELQTALEKVAFDQELRASMIAKGRERVKNFDWGKSVRMTWGVLTGQS